MGAAGNAAPEHQPPPHHQPRDYPERRIFHHTYLPPVFPGYPRSLAAPGDPPIPYIIILGLRTPPPTALLPSCPIPRGLCARKPLAVSRDSVSVGPAISGAVCPHSCYLQGHMPPDLLPTKTPCPSTSPIVIPEASMPPLSQGAIPHPSSLIGHRSPAHPVL